jgi:hypothetical protein
MNRIEQNVPVDASNLVLGPVIVIGMPSPAPQLDFIGSLGKHWPEYLMETALLGTFMVSACLFGALYEFPGSPVRQAIESGFLRRILMGLSMGLTAIAQCRSE